ncbi:MAG: hypothetical protein AAFQ71_07305 [Planctomycetota bacterium]
MQKKIAIMLAACGAASGLASAQLAGQNRVVSGAGATLQEAFFRSPVSTNDFIDVDGDGEAGRFNSFPPDQLTPDFTSVGAFNGDADPTNDNVFFLSYRIIGSGNGILELDTFAGGSDINSDNSLTRPLSGLRDNGGDLFILTNGNPVTTLFAVTDLNGDQAIDAADDLLVQEGAVPGNSRFAPEAIYNRADLVFQSGGLATLAGFGNAAIRGGLPFVPDRANDYQGVVFSTALIDADEGTEEFVGFTVDFSASDVPLSWFGIAGGLPEPDALPTTAGYGANPRLATDFAGNTLQQSNLLRPLNRLNTDGSDPAFQAFDTAISATPVAAITNPGTGLNFGLGASEIYMSDLRHLAATGRRNNGENLTKVTRDSGSGTRNAFMNGLGLDPSWGAGENIGNRSTSSANDRVGPNYTPSNKGGSSRNEGTTVNTRMGIGHTGAERGGSRWIINTPGNPQDLEVLGILADIKGGTVAARPTLDNVIDAGPNGYNVQGPASLSHLGNPRALSADLGGNGFDAGDPVSVPGLPTPNRAAGAYLNNITRSIAAFNQAPGSSFTALTPGELLATQFLLVASTVNANELEAGNLAAAAANGLPIPLIVNPSNSPAVEAFARGSASPLNLPQYGNATTEGGVVPTRTTDVAYGDGSGAGVNNYFDQSGASIAYGADIDVVADNSQVAYDFNGDGVRSLADAVPMIRAFRDRFEATPWAPGQGAAGTVIEILGDGDNDGNFGADDIRYWADGLVLGASANGLGGSRDVSPIAPQGGVLVQGDGQEDDVLNRTAGFYAVDVAYEAETGNNNFFGTTLATGAAYTLGASKADVAGSVGTTPGYAPVGADGVIDVNDIDYVRGNKGDFADLLQAVSAADDGLRAFQASVIDASADMNGDLIIDETDVDEILGALGTVRGDFDLDGDFDLNDRRIAQTSRANGTSPASYGDGDFDGDGDVDSDDVSNGNPGLTLAEFDGNLGVISQNDSSEFVAAFFANDLLADIAAPFGVISQADVALFVSEFFAAP